MKSKTAVILLNYNDAQATCRAAERMLNMPGIDLVVLADNASTVDSRTVLRKFVSEHQATVRVPSDGDVSPETSEVKPIDQAEGRIMLIENEKNGGYGYGNNRGIRAAAGAGCDYALIMNPDVSVPQETVEKMKAALQKESVAAAGARMKGNKETDCAWPLLDFGDELLFNGPLTKRLFKSRVSYPKHFFQSSEAAVGAVHGSLLMVKISEFLKAGCFDEEMFLFMEEKALGQRLRRIGQSVVLTDGTFEHEGSGTMKKQGMDAIMRQKQRQVSERIYYKKYLGANRAQLALACLQQALVLTETRMAAMMRLL